MVKTNRLDIITDLLNERINGVKEEVSRQFKGTNPYRQEPVSPQERIQKYLNTSPEQIQFMRQNFGNQAVDTYIAKMNELILRRQNNA